MSMNRIKAVIHTSITKIQSIGSTKPRSNPTVNRRTLGAAHEPGLAVETLDLRSAPDVGDEHRADGEDDQQEDCLVAGLAGNGDAQTGEGSYLTHAVEHGVEKRATRVTIPAARATEPSRPSRIEPTSTMTAPERKRRSRSRSSRG